MNLYNKFTGKISHHPPAGGHSNWG